MAGKRKLMWGNAILCLLVFYITLLAALFVLQRRLIYHPETPMHLPAEYGFTQASEISLRAADGTKLTAWHAPAFEGAKTLVYFHGNAGHLGDRALKLKVFAEAGYGILAVSYRGFGNSDGSPDEHGIFADARAAMQHLLAQDVAPHDMVLYGESLGSGVAVQMATEVSGVAALVLEAPYTSVAARAQEMYPFVPIGLLIKDHFDSLSKLGQVNAPLLILHGERDDVIPVHHGRRLYDSFPGRKAATFFPEYGHSDFAPQVLVEKVSAFVQNPPQ